MNGIDKMNETRAAYGRLFKTKDGEIVLKNLQAKFKDKPLYAVDPNITLGSAAQHDVIIFIESMMVDIVNK